MTLRNAFEDLAVSSKQDAQIARLDSLLTELQQKLEPADLDSIEAVLASIDVALVGVASAANQSTQIAALDSLLTELQQKLEPADLAGLQATLTAIDAALVGAASEAKQDAQIAALGSLLTELQQKLEASDLDDIETTLAAIQGEFAALATETTIAAVLAELQQKLEAGDLSTVEGTLAAIQTALNDKATETKQDASIAVLESLLTELQQKLEASDLGDIEALLVSIDAALATTSVSANDGPIPASSTLIGGEDDVGNLRSLAVTSTGRIELPNGAASSANQDLTNEALANRYSGGKIPVTATVTASGDTTIYTPALGNKIVLYWVAAMDNAGQEDPATITIKLGSLECYRLPVVSHWEIFEGAVNDPLIVGLSNAANVDVTAHIREVPA